MLVSSPRARARTKAGASVRAHQVRSPRFHYIGVSDGVGVSRLMSSLISDPKVSELSLTWYVRAGRVDAHLAVFMSA